MTLPSFKYNRCLTRHSVILSSAMNNAMSNKLLMITWENSPSAASIIGRDCLSVRGRSLWWRRRWSRTLTLSLPMTDAAGRLLFHVNVSSSLLMALFMAEHLCRATQRLYLKEGREKRTEGE